MKPEHTRYIGAAVVVALLLVWYWRSTAKEKTDKGKADKFEPAPVENIGGLIRYDGPTPEARARAQRAVIESTAQARAGFTGDWPGAGQYGANSSGYPYGNYAGGMDMYYPYFQPPSRMQ